MNIINKLFDEEFALNYLRKKLLPLYPYFKDIVKIKIIPHKKLVWDKTYHVVIEFELIFKRENNKRTKLLIFCSAHSSEPRINYFHGLKFLWEHGFAKGNLTIPHPLFFSKQFNAIFYRGIRGHHLHYYIREHDFKEVENIVTKVAKWLSKLHKIKADYAQNFNAQNALIKTVMPGINFILERVDREHKRFSEVCKNIYEILIRNEENFLASTDKRWLVHGDAHPENFIKISKQKIGAIDFTDLCVSDFARDLGAFSQQLDYMIGKQTEDKEYIEKIKNLFLDSYFKASKTKPDQTLLGRINNYYNFTTMRTATYFLIKEDPDEAKAAKLLKKICDNLNINFNIDKN